MSSSPADLDQVDGPPRSLTEFEPPYNAAKSSEGYANVTGLVSTFAFAAVVLVFLIAATAASRPSPSQQADMGFATIFFAVGFLGCLLAAFQFAALAGAPKNVALTNSMLIAVVVAVCLIGVLAGFEALATAFLHSSASVFTLITVVAAALSPIFVFFPMFDYAREAVLARQGALAGASDRGSSDGEVADEYRGWAMKIIESKAIRPRLEDVAESEERKMIALLLDMTVVAIGAAIVGWVVHHVAVLGRPHQWLYFVVAILALGVIGFATVVALLLAAKPDRQLAASEARRLSWVQVGLMAVMIAALP